MITISNTSPLLNLAVIGKSDILEKLFNRIIIPEAVAYELRTIGEEQSEITNVLTFPWIEIHSVNDRLLFDLLSQDLDKAEAEAIVLHSEMKANILLIDERKGRKIAAKLGIKCMGLLGVIVLAKRKHFIEAVKPILNDLIGKAGFWISRDLYAKVLISVEESL